MKTRSLDELRTNTAALVEKLRTERDELAVQMQLAKAEARDEWHKLEPKWEHFQSRAREVTESAEEASKDIGAVLGLLGEELRRGYDRIRASLRE
jgi:seryl-tRNA synthetase